MKEEVVFAELLTLLSQYEHSNLLTKIRGGNKFELKKVLVEYLKKYKSRLVHLNY